jgi:DNA-binding transcriptional ArsR family regulator
MKDDPRIPLLKELADPVRLNAIDMLSNVGSASVSEIAAHLHVSLPQLSNHLRRLRDAGLVTMQREGRQVIYALADPGLEALMPLLDGLTGRVAPAPERTQGEFSTARRCYDHLAGRLGVSLYDALAERDAIQPQPDGSVELGPQAARVLGSIGVDVETLEAGRRRFAFGCLDVTERRAHLGGALGEAVFAAAVAKGWVEPAGDRRALTVTPAGTRGLKRALGISLAA